MWNGIINVYKEPGYTSHDVVARLRGIFKQKKIGHTGTLDPQAEGVLPVCLGTATKLCDMMTDKDKCYEAVLLLGVTTDTQDMTGTVLKKEAVSEDLTEEKILQVLDRFTGTYDQLPPMYSAVRVDGKRLYQLARKGIEVERKPRPVTVYRLTLLDMELPRLRLRIKCSKGTYIRTLCQDIGDALGPGGAMEKLVRVQSGQFRIEDSLTLGQIEEKMKEGSLAESVLTVEQVLCACPPVYTRPEADRLLQNGNPLWPSQLRGKNGERLPLPGGDAAVRGGAVPGAGAVRVYDSSGRFTGLYQFHMSTGMYRPLKMFLEQ